MGAVILLVLWLFQNLETVHQSTALAYCKISPQLDIILTACFAYQYYFPEYGLLLFLPLVPSSNKIELGRVVYILYLYFTLRPVKHQ